MDAFGPVGYGIGISEYHEVRIFSGFLHIANSKSVDMARYHLAVLVASSLLAVANGAGCLNFAATKNCNPNGRRNPSQDKSCDTQIVRGWAGYCQCDDGRRASPVNCRNRRHFTCRYAQHAATSAPPPRQSPRRGAALLGPAQPDAWRLLWPD